MGWDCRRTPGVAGDSGVGAVPRRRDNGPAGPDRATVTRASASLAGCRTRRVDAPQAAAGAAESEPGPDPCRPTVLAQAPPELKPASARRPARPDRAGIAGRARVTTDSEATSESGGSSLAVGPDLCVRQREVSHCSGLRAGPADSESAAGGAQLRRRRRGAGNAWQERERNCSERKQ